MLPVVVVDVGCVGKVGHLGFVGLNVQVIIGL